LIAGRLGVEIVVDVHRRQRHHPLHSPLAGQRQQLARSKADGAWVQEQSGDALQKGSDRVGPRQVARGGLDTGGQVGGLWVVGDGADLDALAGEQVDEGAPDGAGRSGN
jgi:hypothetical protein